MLGNIGGKAKKVDLSPFTPLGSHTQNAGLATAQTLTPPTINPSPTKILVQAFDQNIRFTLDGAMPTPTFGFRLTATNDPILLTIGPYTILQFVEEAATATLEYVWGI